MEAVGIGEAKRQHHDQGWLISTWRYGGSGVGAALAKERDTVAASPGMLVFPLKVVDRPMSQVLTFA